MAESREVATSLDLALRIGDVLLSSGAGAADVAATMLEVVAACGVEDVSADVTFVELTLRHQPAPGEPAAILVRRVGRRRAGLSLRLAQLLQAIPGGFEPRILGHASRVRASGGVRVVPICIYSVCTYPVCTRPDGRTRCPSA